MAGVLRTGLTTGLVATHVRRKVILCERELTLLLAVSYSCIGGTYWGERGFFRIVRGGAYSPDSAQWAVPYLDHTSTNSTY